MLRRSIVAAAVAALAVTGLAGPAFADSCANVSRPAPAGFGPTTVYTAPLVEGTWLWIPSLSSVFGGSVTDYPPYWGKITPGTRDAVMLGAPDQNGNYTNGKTVSLLGVSALCSPSSHALVVRQTSRGIQSGCE
ncbi:MAG TPA: hypothetical protein VFH66_01035 [Mycobacteriales bacterium]|nr:hypothetical protein [Mycobacteriales bacterium]